MLRSLVGSEMCIRYMVQNNAVGYLQYDVPGVYYLDSRYLNFTAKGTKTPAGAVEGEIINAKKNENVYSSPRENKEVDVLCVLNTAPESEKSIWQESGRAVELHRCRWQASYE